MTLRTVTGVCSALILGSACGVSTGADGVPTSTAAVSASLPFTLDERASVRTEAAQPLPLSDALSESSTTVPDPEAVQWLAPLGTTTGLRLVEARRLLISGCESNQDCVLTVPAAELVYDTDDLAVARSVRIAQSLPGPNDEPGPPVEGVARQLGDREVTVRDNGRGGGGSVDLAWTEPTGTVVVISSVGMSSDELEHLVQSLSPVEPAAWPGTEVVEPLAPCVDETTRFAPTIVPEGWVRYVLEAAPTGSCDVDAFLWMSLVEPGTVDGPGTYVNITVQPATTATWSALPGEPLLIGDRPAVVQSSEQPDGTTQSSIDMMIGAAAISAHGNVTADSLAGIMSTVELLDETEWSALVAQVATDN